MNIPKMAWRNVWRNRRRSLVTISAMAFALWVELLYSGLIVGYMEGMEDDIVDLEVGDMQIFAGDYLERPSLYTVIPEPEPLLQALEGAGMKASARLLGGGLAAAGESSAGVAFRGVDVQRDAGVSLVGESVATGQWLSKDDPKGVVIGRRLARTLSVEPGDELIVLTQAADGSMANDLLTVRGVLMGIAQGTDATTVFMHAPVFRELLGMPEGAHQIIVRRPEEVELAAAATTVRALAEGHPGDLKTLTWMQLMPVVAQMLQGSAAMVGIIFFIVYVAVGILILNAMLMAVFERIREFGVLKAIGVSPGTVVLLILAESAVQAVIALVVGTVLALPGMWYLVEHGINVGSLGGTDMMGIAMRPIWYGVYTADSVATPVVLLVFIVFFAVLYPAFKAAWIQPVEAMRHQ